MIKQLKIVIISELTDQTLEQIQNNCFIDFINKTIELYLKIGQIGNKNYNRFHNFFCQQFVLNKNNVIYAIKPKMNMQLIYDIYFKTIISTNLTQNQIPQNIFNSKIKNFYGKNKYPNLEIIVFQIGQHIYYGYLIDN